MRKTFAAAIGLGALAFVAPSAAQAPAPIAPEVPFDAALGMRVAPGAESGVFHPGLGRGARHITVRANGDVFVAMLDGQIVALRDADGDGKAERMERRFVGGTTSIEARGDFLYFSSDVALFRLRFGEALMPDGEPEMIVSGWQRQRSHAHKTFALDDAGFVYINAATPSNACQLQMRTPLSPGILPCPEREWTASIWRFRADQPGQKLHKDGEKWAEGVRNAMAIAWDGAGKALYLAMHGRDSLDTLWPGRFTAEQSRDLPAEEFHRVGKGADLGWPYTYWDGGRNKRMTAPEYGGDGKTEAQAGIYQDPLLAFPAHWAPNDLIFLDAGKGPAAWRGAALIAFHGSWNRAPFEQQGYNVAIVPMKDGKPAGAAQVFADAFPGGTNPVASPNLAKARPTGLAQGPDGAIYISDSVAGRIWRVTAAE